MNPKLTKAIAYLRAHGVKLGLEVLVNFLLPFLIYDHWRESLGDVKALMASSIPPILWSVVEFARLRKVDAMSVLVIAGIVLSLLAFIGGGGVKVLQAAGEPGHRADRAGVSGFRRHRQAGGLSARSGQHDAQGSGRRG